MAQSGNLSVTITLSAKPLMKALDTMYILALTYAGEFDQLESDLNCLGFRFEGEDEG